MFDKLKALTQRYHLTNKPPSDLTQSRGSATVLRGRIHPLSMFVSTPEEAWSAAHKQNALAAQAAAEHWLQSEARRYGIRLEFDAGEWFGRVRDVTVNEILRGRIDGAPSDGSNVRKLHDYARVLSTQAGLRTPRELYLAVREKYRCSSSHMIVYANTWGRAHALPFYADDNTDDYLLEGCVVYGLDRPGAPDPWLPATIAHEVLHLYGAWDLYRDPAVPEELSAAGELLFPNDVMTDNLNPLGKCVVGPLTAWRIGWTPEEAWLRVLPKLVEVLVSGRPL